MNHVRNKATKYARKLNTTRCEIFMGISRLQRTEYTDVTERIKCTRDGNQLAGGSAGALIIE